ncbi:MAG: FliA/WhiG family RNA polymerase sigma factor [Oscillospiraceae bacterium]|nr:FliA/WhiG family RNA polymerase sigma factor [Oscillospiraceae bacterium]
MAVRKTIGVSDEVWRLYGENKDVETRNFILTEYLHIVKVIAARMYSTYRSLADQDDIISCGTLALLNCIERFDCKRDIKFETFASIRVRGAMIDYLRKMDWVPRTVRKNLKDIDSVYAELQNTLGRSPTDEEIAEKLNMSADGYYEALSNVYSANVLSLEELIADNAAGMAPSSDSTPEKDYENKEMTDITAKAIDALNEKERIIISLYYYEGLKAKQIANVLEISESRVSQLHSKALLKLKYNLQKYMYPE